MHIAAFERLGGAVPKEAIDVIDQYIGGLSPAARALITKRHLGSATGLDDRACETFLERCVEKGIMDLRRAVRCPECSLLLEVETSPTLGPSDEPVFYCSGCNEVYSANDILEAKSFGEKLYALKKSN